MKRWMHVLCAVFMAVCVLLSGCAANTGANDAKPAAAAVTLDTIPEYSGKPYVVLQNNIPNFTEKDKTTKSFETYSPLDTLGRCGPAFANVGKDLMPTEKRGSIGQVKPTGWQIAKYDWVDGKYLYNRCHLIGFQLTGENANERNLITGTRYMNVDGMLPFENMVADYVKETGNHVLYRVTPIFKGGELVARGVQMEAMSVEDNGAGVLFHVFCYNTQPGVVIDYADGSSQADAAAGKTAKKSAVSSGVGKERKTYVLNTNTKKFHLPDCSSAKHTNEKYRKEYKGISPRFPSLIKSGRLNP